jgi:hypothetical protein
MTAVDGLEDGSAGCTAFADEAERLADMGPISLSEK